MAVPSNSENNGKKLVSQMVWWQPAIIMFSKLSAWIAAPVITALYLGRWLDKEFSTAPWLFLFCMALAFFISMIGLVKNTLVEYKKIEEENKKEKTKIN